MRAVAIDSMLQSSDSFEFSDDENAQSLVKRRADAQSKFIGVPVEAGDRLS